MSEFRICGIVGRENVVDGQRMKYAPGTLQAMAPRLTDTAVLFCFDASKYPPVGIVETARMVGPNLEITVKVEESWVPFIKSKNLALRPGFLIESCHQEGNFNVIDQIGDMWIGIVPEELTFAIDAEAEVKEARLMRQMDKGKEGEGS